MPRAINRSTRHYAPHRIKFTIPRSGHQCSSTHIPRFNSDLIKINFTPEHARLHQCLQMAGAVQRYAAIRNRMQFLAQIAPACDCDQTTGRMILAAQGLWSGAEMSLRCTQASAAMAMLNPLRQAGARTRC